VTLWNLPARLEDDFDARWSEWIESKEWPSFFDELQVCGDDLLTMLRERGLLSDAQADEVQRMRRSAEGRAVVLKGPRKVNNDTITLLAAGYCKGKTKNPAVPYARVEA
jgi:hypothetical protein